ncbi:MAG: hypothetical protein RIR79_24 [Pseudomonadota bacterium]|jgi:hypothetical protein
MNLERDAFGKLTLTLNNGQRYEAVAPVRAFPLQAPDEGISLVNTDGKEVVWIPHLSTLPPAAAKLIEEELNGREFVPVITKIASVTSYSTPCTWKVHTDRGDTEFLLRGDEDIRRVGNEGVLLIADTHGIHYLIKNHFELDALSKKILDRFL